MVFHIDFLDLLKRFKRLARANSLPPRSFSSQNFQDLLLELENIRVHQRDVEKEGGFKSARGAAVQGEPSERSAAHASQGEAEETRETQRGDPGAKRNAGTQREIPE